MLAFALWSALGFPVLAQTPAASGPYAQRADAQAALERIVREHSLERAWVAQALAQARTLPAVQRLMAPPPGGTVRNWQAYRARFVEPSRIRAGVAFWQAHAHWLQQAQQRHGVPAELIVGIIGVETLYGRHMGSYRVLDALATLAFDYPAGARDRSAFFLDELGYFLRLCHRDGLEPTEPTGSFAGAMGLGQFMPSSWLKWGVDFDGDGRIDLRSSAADVIGSIANFLVEHGWTAGMPTHFDVRPPTAADDLAALLEPDIIPSFTAEEFSRRGAILPASARTFPDLLALVQLHNADAAPTFVAGTPNFFTVTRYNRSSYYALAVIDLGAEIRRQMPTSEPAAGAATPRGAPMPVDVAASSSSGAGGPMH